LVNGREREGFASAEENGIVVIVSTDMTPELEREGLAREIVHRIQNLRKDAGFEIADRIRTYYAGDDTLREAMRAFDAYVRQETLSVDVLEAPPPPGAHVEDAEVDGRTVNLGVERV
jgi:isoleucyl-tRNA synthetase